MCFGCLASLVPFIRSLHIIITHLADILVMYVARPLLMPSFLCLGVLRNYIQVHRTTYYIILNDNLLS